MRILLVEDDENVAQVVTKGMGEANHHVTHASDGEAGFSRALAERYDVMIFDRMLPGGVDSANLLQNLRQLIARVLPALFVPVACNLSKQWRAKQHAQNRRLPTASYYSLLHHAAISYVKPVAL